MKLSVVSGVISAAICTPKNLCSFEKPTKSIQSEMRRCEIQLSEDSKGDSRQIVSASRIYLARQ